MHIANTYLQTYLLVCGKITKYLCYVGNAGWNCATQHAEVVGGDVAGRKYRLNLEIES